MDLRARFEEMQPREQKLVLMLLGVVGVVVVVVIPVVLTVMVASRRQDAEDYRAAIQAIQDARPRLQKASRAREEVEARYAKAAPPLAGYLDKLANGVQLEIPESQDRPVLPHGKAFEERSTKLTLRKTGMLAFLKFVEGIETSPHPIQVSALNIRKRGSEPDSFDIGLTVSAFDRKAKAKAGEDGAATKNGSEEGTP